MRFRPYGLYSKDGARPPMRPSDFSDDAYDGIRCGVDRKNRPVVIMHGKKVSPYRWKVVYGFSSIFFASFEEALAFCDSRDMKIFKDREDAYRV